MINTDASGQGSCTYGKTRDHVLELSTVLLGGELLHSSPLEKSFLEQETARRDRIGKVYRCAVETADNQADLIAQIFPKLNRCLTGYDLAQEDSFNINSVLCGSKGSLGFSRGQAKRLAYHEVFDPRKRALCRFYGCFARRKSADAAQAFID